MSSFGQDFLKGVTQGIDLKDFGKGVVAGFVGNNVLRDYQHASRTFTTNAYELKPRYKFLFHVSFTLNVTEIPFLNSVFTSDDIMNLSLTVKTIDLPKFNIDTETLNQYNRKRIIQKKINYDPVNVTFHDTSNDLTRRMWYYYMSYYYKDPTQKYLEPNNTNGTNGSSSLRQTGFGYNDRDIYDSQRIGNVNDWGYIGEAYNDGSTAGTTGKPPFFRDIRIYGMDQRKFAEYVLINPLITSWGGDQYSYAEGNGTMQNSMTIAYETVKYYSGAVGRAQSGGDPNVQGFATDAHYDKTVSPIARPGANATVFGQGGLLDAGAGILGDLQSGSVLGYIGAAQKAARLNKTFRGKNLGAITASEALALGKTTIQQGITPGGVRQVANKADGWLFPTPKTAPASTPAIGKGVDNAGNKLL
jgi:hypothetical protein